MSKEVHYIWVATGKCGTSIQFDCEPSKTDILNVCEDLEYPVRVDALTLSETDRSEIFTVEPHVIVCCQ